MSDAWPKRPDGRNMTLGEMSPEQRRTQIKKAARRVARDFGARSALLAAILKSEESSD